MHHHINDVWKKYEEHEITHSIVHYLFAIDELLREKGYARAVDIAKILGITAGSCSISLKKLLKKGLISEDENKFLHLSSDGKNIVEKTKHTRSVLIDFFVQKLSIDHEQAEVNACKIEHLISDDIIKKIQKL